MRVPSVRQEKATNAMPKRNHATPDIAHPSLRRFHAIQLASSRPRRTKKGPCGALVAAVPTAPDEARQLIGAVVGRGGVEHTHAVNALFALARAVDDWKRKRSKRTNANEAKLGVS